MTFIYALLAAGLFGCGIFMVLSRNMVRMLLGLSLLTTSVNVMIFHTGRFRSQLPPIIPDGAERLVDSADPVPQALILTAIVIGFALTVVLTALTLRVHRGHESIVTREVRSAESLGDPLLSERDT